MKIHPALRGLAALLTISASGPIGLAGTCDPTGPLDSSLPSLEISWGGYSSMPSAQGSPFSSSSQSLSTPLIVNLDDDNGDQVIDEQDFPEIVFVTHCGGVMARDGVLRAIHGGGQFKGADYFANCAGTLWREEDPLPISCTCEDAEIDASAGLAAGDLDGDGIPEIVAISEGLNSVARVLIFDNTGLLLASSAITTFSGNAPSPAIANLDNSGFAEIVVGRHVFTLFHNPSQIDFLDHFEGAGFGGTNGPLGPISCIADLTADGKPEIIGGTTAYTFPVAPEGVGSREECTGLETGEQALWCEGTLAMLWDAGIANPGITDDGWCAVVDVWGADIAFPPGLANPLDGTPEVITVSDGWLQIFRAIDGQLLHRENLYIGDRGGPPMVNDLDGDGFPEIATAGSDTHIVTDLQTPRPDCPFWPTAPPDDLTSAAAVNPIRNPPPGSCTEAADCGDTTQFTCNTHISECVCLHNGWRRRTEDASSLTGSSSFDLNGDGIAEVLYRDECRFRVYDGLDAYVIFSEPTESRSRTESPVVGDIDGDDEVEIVFSLNNDSGSCSEISVPVYSNGIQAWGRPGTNPLDRWVGGRPIWNQHAYHRTNIVSDMGVPAQEVGIFTSYRSNVCEGLEVIYGPSTHVVYEPGGDISFSVSVRNTAIKRVVTIENLTDTVFGDISGMGDCSVPQALGAGEEYQCSFTATVTGHGGASLANVLTVSGPDELTDTIADRDCVPLLILSTEAVFADGFDCGDTVMWSDELPD